MKAIDFINKRVKELFERYEKEDFNIIEELMKEAGYKTKSATSGGISKDFSFYFFSFLIERIYEFGIKKKKVINSLYLVKNLPKSIGISIGQKNNNPNTEEVYPGVILHKDTFIKVLEILGLKETKQVYINWEIIQDNELNKKVYLSDNQIKKFGQEQAIEDSLTDEWERKIKSKQRLISFNN